MKITWIGHSCYKIESEGFSIILDPYADGSVPGYKPVREKADMVLCSHGHGDHNAVHCVEVSGRTDNPLRITKIETFHDNLQGELRGKNTIHILDDGLYRVAHLGDLGCTLKPDQAKLLSNLDAVMIPVGGYYTIDAEQAVKITAQIKPKVILPMHYRSDEHQGIMFGYDVLDTVADFLEYFDKVVTLDGSTMDTRQPSDGVVILCPQNI